MENKYDIIVIGAGVGGLTASAILSRNGYKVLLLEKNPLCGGYSINFKRKGYIFDAVIHLVNGCDINGLTFNILEKAGISTKIKFLTSSTLYRSIFPDFDFTVSQNDINSFKELLKKYFRAEESNIEKLFVTVSKIFSENRQFFLSMQKQNIKLTTVPILYPNLFLYSNRTLQSFLDKFLKNYQLKAIFSQFWPYLGLPPSKLSALYYLYPWHDYLCNGGFYPEGGGQALSNALLEAVKENGGEVRFNEEVKKINIKNNEVNAVITKNENVYYSNKIISGIDASKTLISCIDDKFASKNNESKIAKMELSISAFMVYLGLNTDINKLNIKDYEIFINPNYDLDRQFKASLGNDMENVMFTISVYPNIDKNCNLPNKSTIGITALSGYDFWLNMTKDKYRSKKQEFAEILIRRSEKFLPSLSSSIDTIETASPLTLEKYTGNSRGAIYGWSQIVSQSGFRRLGIKTPIKGLYLVGAWTFPGGGISAVIQSGEIAANTIINKKY